MTLLASTRESESPPIAALRPGSFLRKQAGLRMEIQANQCRVLQDKIIGLIIRIIVR